MGKKHKTRKEADGSTKISNHHFSKDDESHLRELKDVQNSILRKIKKRIPRKKYYLTQSSFKTGTYQIRKPGIYILKEDITFAPNPSNEFRPLKGDERYSNRAYSLGFFAAITIETDGVEIDLNGKTLQQSDEMAWMQRFYANIETASTPFIAGQGPGDFGSTITSPKYIYIHNGILGRSSHHAIHGNGNKYLVVDNVKMVDYEFVGSAINGGDYIVHQNCQVLHNFRDLKVLATWSAALFAQQFADAIFDKASTTKSITPDLYRNFNNSRLRLRKEIETTKSELFTGKDVSNPLFRNPLKIGDGNMYGILSHPLGVAINEFTSSKTLKKPKASYFFVDNCLIKDIEGDVDEVVTLKDPEGKVQKGPSGDFLKLDDCSTSDGKYKPNAISDMIFALAHLKRAGYSFSYGTLEIHDDVLRWARGQNTITDLLNRGFTFVTSQDSMGHHGKGVIGIRVDGTKHVVLTHNQIEDVVNRGRMGATYNRRSGVRDGDKDYDGVDAHGVHVSYSDDVWLERSKIVRVVAYNGESCGMKAINASNGMVKSCIISDIESGEKYEAGEWSGRDHHGKFTVYKTVYPNPCPSSKGVVWSRDCTIKCDDVRISDLSGPQRFYAAIM